MEQQVTKWGNSYAIRLPKHMVDELQLEAATVTLEQKGKEIILRKASKQEQLKDLLKRMPPPQKVDWGEPRGKEVW